MEKIIQVMSKIPNDKLLHCVYGMLLFCTVVGFTGVMFAAVVVTGVAIVKEVVDVSGTGFDLEDIVATIMLPWILVLVL